MSHHACVIRRYPAADSDGIRPSIPIEAGHPIEADHHPLREQ
jgi:hypothetical protein